MKYDIKEILDNIKYAVDEDDWFEIEGHFLKPLLDYITNLQEKSNNQAEEINRLYKQREKFMKKYGYLKEENERLKQLCDEYEEEHNNEFQCWKRDRKELLNKRTIIDKAIEYIKSFYETPEYIDAYDITYWTDEVMKILNGGDEE